MLSLEYVAGYFDGEGCISLYKHHKNQELSGYLRYGLYCRVASVNPKILELFKKYFGGSISKRVARHENHRDTYCWSISAKKADHFLTTLYDFFKLKKAEAKLALEYRKKSYYEIWVDHEYYVKEMSRLKRLKYSL